METDRWERERAREKEGGEEDRGRDRERKNTDKTGVTGDSKENTE